jgi:formate-dependent nitrite reductase membrane component NrfD
MTRLHREVLRDAERGAQPVEIRETVGTRDGRNVDPEIGRLLGEGSLQRVRKVDAEPSGLHEWLGKSPEQTAGVDYYGVPLLKEPVWKWYVPTYFYVGGVAGASAALGAAVDLFGGRGMSELSRRSRLVAASGAAVSAALLIADLGRPARFFNMLRVFRPSSPMNVGSWILSGFGACAGLAALPAIVPLPREARRACDVAWTGAGLIGLGLTGYTGVLLADTAVPIWQGARRALPILFSASGAAGAAALFQLWPPGGRGEKAVHTLGTIAKASEVAMTLLFEAEAGVVPRVARPLRSGASGALWRSAQLLTAASLAVSLVSRRRGILAGALGTAGALALRFAVMSAGRKSARDARASFEQQRAGRGAADVAPAHAERQRPATDLQQLQGATS